MSASQTNNSKLQKNTSKKGVILPIIVGAAGLFTMSYVGYLLRTGQLPLLTISPFNIVNFTFTMQLYVLPLSFMGLLFLFTYNRNAFRTFFRLRLKTGKDQETSWQIWGAIMAIGFTIGTAMFMSFDVIANKGMINGTFFKLFPLVMLFAATNAWTEEILSRFVIVAGLFGKIRPAAICWVSAVIFGIPHFIGTPGGLFGVVMTGFLGWLLAKSVIETKSIGWALFIHFLLDIVIFGAGAMIVAGSV
jgi:membrane protease YdiL (CAAX protease family)